MAQAARVLVRYPSWASRPRWTTGKGEPVVSAKVTKARIDKGKIILVIFP